MERLIELFINTEDGEFYDRGGLLAAYDPAINAGELVRLTVQLCAGVPAFNSDGALLNPDTTFAGTLAAAETIIDNNFNWYDKGTLLENLTTGTAISELSVASEAAPRQLGAVRLNAGTVVNFCGWTATEGGYRLTLADNEFNPVQFTPTADFAHGAAVEVLEQPIIVSAQNDDSGRATGLFTGLLDAANPVYESMIEGHEDIPGCRIEFSIYQDGRAVFRARRYFDCLGAMAMNKGAAYVHSDSWREADSRYIKLVDWQAPPEYQFSEDGTNWHDQQQDADLYYHERRPGGQWGGAVKMKIGPTGAAAGFGTPSVTVETLPAGSDATASVTASGDNTAKVFSFNFGIPKGADGKNGTDGKAGADGAAGADGVSSYTYVAYASDASGGGFSLTPSNALKFRAEIHTTTAIETPDAADFAGATWVKYIGDDGTGAGDMLKSVYDTNDDGIVDHAATADAVGATTAAQVADAVGKAHTHANKATLDKLAEADGKLTFDGSEIGGGGTVDESRLLPALDSVPVDRSGNPVVFKAVSEGMDEHTLLYCPFDADMNDHSNAGGQFVQTGQKSESIVTNEKKFGSGCLNCGSGYSFLNGPLAKPVGDVDCTIHFWANITSFTGKSPFTLLTAAIPDDSNATSNFGQAAIGCLQLYVSNDLLLLERRTSSNGQTVRIIEASVSLTTGAWNHFAITRSGNIWYLFLNGQLLGTESDTNVASATHIRIGGDSSAMSGYVDEFLVLDYAKWITDFEPPTQPATTLTKSYEVSDKGAGAVKSVNGQLPDESGNVTVETGGAVDESRLLPENPANGDIPCYSNEPPEGVNYNDANTVLLLQGSSDNTAAASTSERLNGIVTGEFPVQSDGSLLVTGSSNYITFNDADTRRVFSGEFTLETYIKTTQFTASDKRQDTNWCVVYRNGGSVTDYQWLLLSDFYADAGKFGIWPYPQMSGETFPKTLINAEFQHVAIDVYMVDGVRKFTMYRNGVPYHTGNYWSTTPADWSSSVSAAMRLFGEGTSGGDDYLSNASVMSLRVSNIARYKGVSFDPPADGKYLTPPAGYWSKLNKSLLAQKSDVLPEWHQLSGSSAITLDRANGELQKVTLTQNCTLTAPTLDADHPTLLLQVTSSSAVTVTVGETNIVTDHTGTFQVGWFYDGETTRRYPVVEVA